MLILQLDYLNQGLFSSELITEHTYKADQVQFVTNIMVDQDSRILDPIQLQCYHVFSFQICTFRGDSRGSWRELVEASRLHRAPTLHDGAEAGTQPGSCTTWHRGWDRHVRHRSVSSNVRSIMNSERNIITLLQSNFCSTKHTLAPHSNKDLPFKNYCFNIKMLICTKYSLINLK